MANNLSNYDAKRQMECFESNKHSLACKVAAMVTPYCVSAEQIEELLIEVHRVLQLQYRELRLISLTP